MFHKLHQSRGFSLVELLVAVAIMVLILLVVNFYQSTYTDGAALTNLADEISLSLSQAQVYGIGVREFSPGSSEFSASYGLAFSILSSGSDKAYISFADRNDNDRYDNDWSCPVVGGSECLSKSNISEGNYITLLCAIRTPPSPDICNTVKRVDISFARPNTDAQLVFYNSGGSPFDPGNTIGAKVVLRSPGGKEIEVSVYEVGQISVGSYTGGGGGGACSNPTIVGTSNNDTLNGTNGNDVILGNGGNDIVNSGSGNDIICTGSGNDTVYGGNGDDRIIDTGGNNNMYGENGKDTITTGSGNDYINGGNGTDDSCNGGGGSDTIVNCE